MELQKKEIILYTIIFLIFYVFAKSGIYISSYLKFSQDIILLLCGIVFTVLIYFITTEIKDSFYFELTPEKHCEGGAYMYSSNKAKKEFCSQFTPSQIKDYSCNVGFHGAPVHWERTDMSDSKWENKMCDGNFNNYNDPKVL